jgi:hypothetical protein
MTYRVSDGRCDDCPHNGEATIAEAQAQYLEHVIEDEDDELARLRVCVTCRTYQAWQQAGGSGLPDCGVADVGDGLRRCEFSPSRWTPYWLSAAC